MVKAALSREIQDICPPLTKQFEIPMKNMVDEVKMDELRPDTISSQNKSLAAESVTKSEHMRSKLGWRKNNEDMNL